MFGGVNLAASDILYVGVTQNAGLYKVNLRVPDQVADGDQSLVIMIGGVKSSPGGLHNGEWRAEHRRSSALACFRAASVKRSVF